MRSGLIRIGAVGGLTALAAGAALIAAAYATGLPFTRVFEQSVRIAAAHTARVIYAQDLAEAHALARVRGSVPDTPDTPVFVMERPDAPHLVALRERYRLDRIIEGASSEYEAQIKLAAWVGTRFEHGNDAPPGGRQVCDTIGVIEAGQRGARYWCEIAAYTMIHAAQAMGWPARMITASTDAYTWDHAVAELWSAEHRKWYVVDADFNVVFERSGVPMSAWELVHDAPALRASGQLVTRRFARMKEGLVPQDPLRFYAYVHLHFRTDWCTRQLRRASPAGGDLNTRWTARSGNEPSITPIPAANSAAQFNLAPSPAAYRNTPASTLNR